MVDNVDDYVTDFGAVGMRVRCQGPGILFPENTDIKESKIGIISDGYDFSSYQHCPDGSAVCGLETRVDHDDYFGDDLGITDVVLHCCLY